MPSSREKEEPTARDRFLFEARAASLAPALREMKITPEADVRF